MENISALSGALSHTLGAMSTRLVNQLLIPYSSQGLNTKTNWRMRPALVRTLAVVWGLKTFQLITSWRKATLKNMEQAAKLGMLNKVTARKVPNTSVPIGVQNLTLGAMLTKNASQD